VLDGRYEQLRHAALHSRASAFPLGLGVLTGRGVTAWCRVLAHLAGAAVPDTAEPASGANARIQAPVPLPEPAAAKLVHALAAVAVALAGT